MWNISVAYKDLSLSCGSTDTQLLICASETGSGAAASPCNWYSEVRSWRPEVGAGVQRSGAGGKRSGAGVQRSGAGEVRSW